ncbi:MAG: glycine cleavage system protein GcvH [Gammaproteobacteria bacterium]
MSEIPEDLRFTSSHEWLKVTDDGTVLVGITDHAQDALGDLVYVEPPEEGNHYSAGDACAVVESVKAASDIYCPIAGVVAEANDALVDAPELINNQPYGDGWIMSIQPDNLDDVESLMDAEAYEDSLQE